MTRTHKQIQQRLQLERQLLSIQLRQISGQERNGTGSIVEAQVHSRQRVKLASIERALNRLAKGTFGVCQTCGAPIDSERLSVLPYAEQCIDCQRKLERKTIHRYGYTYTTH
jgi:RNA polymerase-binding transcription factor DksA